MGAMTMPTTIPGLLNSSEAADFLGITDSLVRRFCRLGRIRARRFGSNWAIEKVELEQFKQLVRPAGNPSFRR